MAWTWQETIEETCVTHQIALEGLMNTNKYLSEGYRLTWAENLATFHNLGGKNIEGIITPDKIGQKPYKWMPYASGVCLFVGIVMMAAGSGEVQFAGIALFILGLAVICWYLIKDFSYAFLWYRVSNFHIKLSHFYVIDLTKTSYYYVVYYSENKLITILKYNYKSTPGWNDTRVPGEYGFDAQGIIVEKGVTSTNNSVTPPIGRHAESATGYSPVHEDGFTPNPELDPRVNANIIANVNAQLHTQR